MNRLSPVLTARVSHHLGSSGGGCDGDSDDSYLSLAALVRQIVVLSVGNTPEIFGIIFIGCQQVKTSHDRPWPVNGTDKKMESLGVIKREEKSPESVKTFFV